MFKQIEALCFMIVFLIELLYKTASSTSSHINRLCQKLYEKMEMNIENRNGSVGQASRLSELTWRRHLPHYQLSSGYYFITFSTHDRFILHPPQKDCVFNAVCFLDGKKYKLYAAVVLNDGETVLHRQVRRPSYR